MQHVGDLGADEGRADQHLALGVDDEAGRAGRAAAVEARPGGARGRQVDRLGGDTRLAGAASSVWPDRGDLGVGEDDPRRAAARPPSRATSCAEDVVGGDARLVLALSG